MVGQGNYMESLKDLRLKLGWCPYQMSEALQISPVRYMLLEQGMRILSESEERRLQGVSRYYRCIRVIN